MPSREAKTKAPRVLGQTPPDEVDSAMPVPEPSPWVPSGRLLKLAVGTPPVAFVLFWVWSYLAWHLVFADSLATVAQKRQASFWASELPFAVFGGGAIAVGLLTSVVLAVRRHGWLIVLLGFHYVAFLLLMFVAGCLLLPTRLFPEF